MTDRVIVYDGALPQTTDILNTNIFGMINAGFKNAALVGTNTAVAGLAVTPTTPTASLQVNVATGSIFQTDQIDASAYGSLGTNTATIVKQGILPTAQVLTITPPGTSGFSQVYLVQAILNDIDAGSMVLSYYNSANPAQPFSGPANSGTSNYTIRQCRCVIALKAGTPASTGTQVAPSADAGYVGLYTITVANGQTQITSTSIAQLASAPFFPTLPQVPYGVMNGTYVYAGQDTGVANAYVITFAAGQPIPTAYVAGMGVKFKALNANLATVTSAAIQAGGSGGTAGTQTVTVVGGTGTASTLSVTVSGGAITAVLSVLTAGSYSVAPTNPVSVTGAGLTGATLNLTLSGASTININGLGGVSIRRASGVALALGDIVSGQMVELTYDGTNFQMQNYLGAGATSNTTTITDIPYVADSGAQNAIVATYSPSIGAYTDGLYAAVKLAYTITGACTINANGLGVKSVVLGDGSQPPYNAFVAGMDLLLVYSTAMGKFQIANTSAGMFYLRPTSNYTIYVNTSIGSDTLYDGTSASVVGGSSSAGPFKTIGKAMLAAFGYAPSQYSITINVAAGTYNEAVTTPLYAGPNVIINGASAASVTISSGSAHTVTVSGPNTMTVQNVTVQNGGANYGGLVSTSGATLTTSNTASNAIGAGVFYANGGTINAGSHTFNGSCGMLYYSLNGGNVQIGAVTQTFSASISVSTASAVASQGGTVGCVSTLAPTYVNASYVSGPKYAATYNGTVVANGLGVNFYPGTVAGSTSTGGQYEP